MGAAPMHSRINQSNGTRLQQPTASSSGCNGGVRAASPFSCSGATCRCCTPRTCAKAPRNAPPVLAAGSRSAPEGGALRAPLAGRGPAALAPRGLLLRGRPALGRGRPAARSGLLPASAGGAGRVRDPRRPLLRHPLPLQRLVLLLVLHARPLVGHGDLLSSSFSDSLIRSEETRVVQGLSVQEGVDEMSATRRLLTLCVTVPLAALFLLVLAAPAWAADAGTDEPQIVLTGQVVVPAGQTVGDVVICNGPATIHGTVRGSVTSFHGDVSISGTVTGSVTSFNGSVDLADAAHIGGDLSTRSRPSVAAGAT